MIRPQAALVDLLERVLDRGLLVNADIIISLAGVPLVGVKLSAALAGVEMMVDYGFLDRSVLKCEVLAPEAAEPLPLPAGSKGA